MELLTERYADRLVGVLSCYDRMLITPDRYRYFEIVLGFRGAQRECETCSWITEVNVRGDRLRPGQLRTLATCSRVRAAVRSMSECGANERFPSWPWRHHGTEIGYRA
jgi:hypothetical protein